MINFTLEVTIDIVKYYISHGSINEPDIITFYYNLYLFVFS